MEQEDEETRQIWKLLWQDTVQLHVNLEEFCYLYSGSPERVELMNATARCFFWQLQNTLWDNLLLQLCRLTDSEQSFGKQNLSIRYLLQLLRTDQSPSAHHAAQLLVDAAVEACSFARDRRNQRLAHRDLRHAVGLRQCESATLGMMKSAVTSVGKAMDAMDPAGGQSLWTPGEAAHGCRSLLAYLQEGRTALLDKDRTDLGRLDWL